MSKAPKNYRWWQEHGDGWRDEVEARKARMPIYHLQEIFLEEYFSEVAPARILEFGCGFGRHLQYLRRIPKLEVHGFDQSESMVGSMRWARADWRAKRVQVGKPLNKLPYADGEFDVVLTVSVLIHVRPRDLEKVLSELVRVSKGHLIHIENNETDETFKTSDAHDGCWAHDLRTAYGNVAPDMSLEVAPKMFDLEDVYQVLAPDVAAPRLPTRARASRFMDLDRSLSAEVERLQRGAVEATQRRDVIAAEVAELREGVETIRARARTAEERVDAALVRARTAEARIGETLERARKAEEAQAELLERARDAERARAELLSRARAAEERIEPLLNRATHAEGRMAELEERLEAAIERARRAEPEVEIQRDRARAAETRAESLSARIVELRNELGSVVAGHEASLAAMQRERDGAVRGRQELEEAMRGVWDREEAAEAREAELLERAERERHRADRLAEAVMRAEATEERIVGQERDAQSRVIALRRRAEKAEALVVELRARAVAVEERLVRMRERAEAGEQKADAQRRRARKAESEFGESSRQLEAASDRLRVERQRADEALGRIDAARQARLEAEAELVRVRSELAALLGS